MSFLKSIKKDKVKAQPPAQRVVEPSYLPQVKKKLLGHPDYQACGDPELTQLAFQVSQPNELLSYFNITEEGTDEAKSLPVQLVLWYHHYEHLGPIELILQEQYGPLNAYIVIGDQIVQWDWMSVVIPHGKPIHDAANVTGKDDAISNLPAIKIELLSRVVQVIADYNIHNYFHLIHRNSQTFVREILSVMKFPPPQQLETKMRAYLEKLEGSKSEFLPADFNSHASLDECVMKRRDQLTQADIEYLFLHYFILHTLRRIIDPSTRECRERNCRMKMLERQIDQENMILNKFKTVRYDFQLSTNK